MSTSLNPDKIIVFLDFAVENESIGRVVIELNSIIVPKSAENFRALCTGEKVVGICGKPLYYKNSIIHRTVPEFMIQGGDIINFDGTGGESIYGLFFEDENFTLEHTVEGVVSMANTGKPNSNNSQFFITVAPCRHLNGQNVAIGKVIKGFRIIKEISNTETINDRPTLEYKIINCGQLENSSDYGINEDDGTSDKVPPWPEDWSIKKELLEIDVLSNVVHNIKESGNSFYKNRRYFIADRKYRKAIEYVKWYTKIDSERKEITDKKQKVDSKMNDSNDPLKEVKQLKEIEKNCLLNLSAVKLQTKNYKECIKLCSKVLELDENNVKAIFRQGQANVGLNNHELGLQYFKKSYSLAPHDKNIAMEIRNVERSMSEYLAIEKKTFAKMFKN